VGDAVLPREVVVMWVAAKQVTGVMKAGVVAKMRWGVRGHAVPLVPRVVQLEDAVHQARIAL